jgi:pimeloyl-ACP methyl ester carboxylesterase
MESYADWLITELEGHDEAVHLVDHDWGGILVLRAVSLRPDLVASWVTDAAGTVDPVFVWHPLQGSGRWRARVNSGWTRNSPSTLLSEPPPSFRSASRKRTLLSWPTPSTARWHTRSSPCVGPRS